MKWYSGPVSKFFYFGGIAILFLIWRAAFFERQSEAHHHPAQWGVFWVFILFVALIVAFRWLMDGPSD